MAGANDTQARTIGIAPQMLRRRTFLALALASATGACAGPRVPMQVPAEFDAPYTLDAGDKLRIVVFGQENLTNTYAVDAAGFIAMPLIGQIPARGMTTTDLRATIGQRLRNGYIRDPHVAVEIEAYRPFFIMGEVTQSGQYPYVAGMTVETAVAIAGGFSPRARRGDVEISRHINGSQLRSMVPVTYSVRPGDTIVVHERWF